MVKKIRPWHLINTSVRNPFRLRSGLEALKEAGFLGNLGKNTEEEVAKALDRAGVITLSPTTKDITSISRKWRGALMKMGFIWGDPATRKTLLEEERGQLGAPYSLTPCGEALLAASTFEAQQEVYLRSIVALQLPSPFDRSYKMPPFSPLSFILNVMLGLEEIGEEPFISRLEMASIVSLRSPESDMDSLLREIIDLRERRLLSPAKRSFDTKQMKSLADGGGYAPGTYYDYQDVTFRYLKATGLFHSCGRGITIAPEKSYIAKAISKQPVPDLTSFEYQSRLAKGATLPTDDLEGASKSLEQVSSIAKSRGITVVLDDFDLSNVQGVNNARFSLENAIRENRELEFSLLQPEMGEEILAYLKALSSGKPVSYGEDLEAIIPGNERAAYFEWVLWRIILAFNHLVIPSSKVRHFNIDQDLLPISTASGGGSDVFAEYAAHALVVEVTLTENSRQEAAEGEPVRRHVADVFNRFRDDRKVVYGLFVARKIDTNTAETFRVGRWYLPGDERIDLDIIPLTIDQLTVVVETAFAKNSLEPGFLLSLLEKCARDTSRSVGAPEWKESISSIVDKLPLAS